MRVPRRTPWQICRNIRHDIQAPEYLAARFARRASRAAQILRQGSWQMLRHICHDVRLGTRKISFFSRKRQYSVLAICSTATLTSNSCSSIVICRSCRICSVRWLHFTIHASALDSL